MTDLAAMIEAVTPMMAGVAVELGHPHGSALFDDLMAAARLKLVRVGPKFDPARKVKWVTFAHVCIRRAMLDEIEAQHRRRPVAVPELEAEAPRSGEYAGVDVAAALADPSIPRIYRRALTAGSATGVYRTGIPKRESVKVFQWATYRLRQRLADRAR